MVRSGKVADVVVGMAADADLEARLRRHREALPGLGRQPGAAARQQVLARTAHALHDFGRTGVKSEGGGQDHADRFFAAVGQREAVADALAVEIDVGLGLDGHAVELGGAHGDYGGAGVGAVGLPELGSGRNQDRLEPLQLLWILVERGAG